MADPEPFDDHALMAAVRDGDRAAFATLYARYAPPLMTFLHGLCRDRALAEDLVQETFLAAWRAAPRWRPRARVSTWLFQIARRGAWKRLRRRRRRGAVEARGGRAAGARAPAEAFDLLRRREEAHALEDALGELSPRLRVVFVLVRLLDRPYAEVAAILRLPVGTVKSRMAAAEARLRAALEGGEARP